MLINTRPVLRSVGPAFGREPFSATNVSGASKWGRPMESEENELVKKTFKQRGEEDRLRTDRAFSGIFEAERRARIEKTTRLRSMRLVKND